MRMKIFSFSWFLTFHLGFKELNERLREGLDPLVHEVVARLGRVLIIQELNVLFLNGRDKNRIKCW